MQARSSVFVSTKGKALHACPPCSASPPISWLQGSRYFSSQMLRDQSQILPRGAIDVRYAAIVGLGLCKLSALPGNRSQHIQDISDMGVPGPIGSLLDRESSLQQPACLVVSAFVDKRAGQCRHGACGRRMLLAVPRFGDLQCLAVVLLGLGVMTAQLLGLSKIAQVFGDIRILIPVSLAVNGQSAAIGTIGKVVPAEVNRNMRSSPAPTTAFWQHACPSFPTALRITKTSRSR